MAIKSMTEAIDRAIRRHRETRQHYVVCEMDEGEGRLIKVMPESYTHGDEFERNVVEVSEWHVQRVDGDRQEMKLAIEGDQSDDESQKNQEASRN
jgi:low affinity Fe/Cu permease